MVRLEHVLAALSILLIVGVLASVRRAHIRVEYSVSWFAAALALLVLSLWRGLLERVAKALGIGGEASGPLALLVVAGALFLLVLFRLSIMISNLKDSNVALAQRLAILEYRQQHHEETETQGK